MCLIFMSVFKLRLFSIFQYQIVVGDMNDVVEQDQVIIDYVQEIIE